jgi:hypothetical protein
MKPSKFKELMQTVHPQNVKDIEALKLSKQDLKQGALSPIMGRRNHS